MKQNRKIFLDILRILASFAVVTFHVFGSSTHNDPIVDPYTLSLINGLSATLKWHVPIFLTITGYLWLRENKECTYSNMLSNLRRFIFVLFTFGFSYAMMERLFTEHSISLKTIALSLADVCTGHLWDHMWYLYAIIGIYLILPMIKPFFQHASLKDSLIAIGILFFFSILSPTLKEKWGYIFPIKYSITYTIFYVCLGGILSKLSLPKKYSIFIISTLFSSFFIFLINSKYLFLSAFSDIFICISTISIFCLIYRLFSDYKGNRLLFSLSSCSFGIYLIHPFFLNLMIKVFHIYPLRFFPAISLILCSIFIFFLSYFIILLLRKIPFLKTYLL